MLSCGAQREGWGTALCLRDPCPAPCSRVKGRATGGPRGYTRSALSGVSTHLDMSQETGHGDKGRLWPCRWPTGCANLTFYSRAQKEGAASADSSAQSPGREHAAEDTASHLTSVIQPSKGPARARDCRPPGSTSCQPHLQPQMPFSLLCFKPLPHPLPQLPFPPK